MSGLLPSHASWGSEHEIEGWVERNLISAYCLSIMPLNRGIITIRFLSMETKCRVSIHVVCR